LGELLPWQRPAARKSGFAALEDLPSGRVSSYQPYWAARAHLLHLLNRKEEAQKAFTRAASLTDDPALRHYLLKRAENDV
jgi:predicted RNA polymerase sigma factor